MKHAQQAAETCSAGLQTRAAQTAVENKPFSPPVKAHVRNAGWTQSTGDIAASMDAGTSQFRPKPGPEKHSSHRFFHLLGRVVLTFQHFLCGSF
jgi:hypothetical protein